MFKPKKWHKNERKTVYDTPFLKVYEDEVVLPNGKLIPNYSVIEKPSIVVVVAFNREREILLLNEYKYAADKYLWGLPGGHIKSGESPIQIARKELEEETGFKGKSATEVGILREYPTKDLHEVYVVSLDDVRATGNMNREKTETILEFKFFSKKEIKYLISQKKTLSSSTISALVLSDVFI